MTAIVSREAIESKIYLIRGQKVMLDRDLAELYEVSTKVLVQAVKRNVNRFPRDFMFRLENQDVAGLRSQIVTLNQGRGKHRKYLPYAFTEQGVAMLSSVLNSDRAVEVNIQIIRVFVQLREMIASHKDLAKRLNELEKKYDAQFQIVFDAIRELIVPPDEDRRKIGFLAKESPAQYAAGAGKV